MVRFYLFNLPARVALPYFLVLFCIEFRTGKSPILLATDVASRGLGKIAMCELSRVLTDCLITKMYEMFCIMMMMCPFNSAGMSHSFYGGHAMRMGGGVNPAYHSLSLKPYVTG